MTEPVKVLITGANGLIGNLVLGHLATFPEYYTVYGMLRHREPSDRATHERYFQLPEERVRMADLLDFEAVQRAVQEMEVVVHLAGDPDGQAGWNSVLQNNIIGSYHLFEACRMGGVKRVIYASTNQVVFGYSSEEPYASLFEGRFSEVDWDSFHPISYTQPTRPLNLYSCSKVFGESLAYMYAARFNLSCICLRIGWVLRDDHLPDERAQILWCSQRDIVHLIESCIRAPDNVRFDIFFGHSNNRYNLVDMQHAREVLGYEPQDRAEDRWS